MRSDLVKYGEVSENVDLSLYTSYKTGGKCKYFIAPSSSNDLIELIGYLNSNNVKFFIIGNGSNILVSDSFYDGVVITLKQMGAFTVNLDDLTLYAEAGAMMPKVVMEAIDHSLKGIEFAAAIPGTVGGSIVGNAGAYNSAIMDYVREIVVIENNELKFLHNDDIKYSYRYTSLKDNKNIVVVAAKFQLEEGDKEKSMEIILDRNRRRAESQPLEFPSAGSVFRNPEGDFAGRLIEESGLKGKRIGGAMVSEKHANFIINYDNASSDDIYQLIKEVHDCILEHTGVDLIVEQEFIGWE